MLKLVLAILSPVQNFKFHHTPSPQTYPSPSDMSQLYSKNGQRLHLRDKHGDWFLHRCFTGFIVEKLRRTDNMEWKTPSIYLYLIRTLQLANA